jgi:hypothetical protein
MGGRSRKSSSSNSNTVNTAGLQQKGASQQAANMSSAFGMQKALEQSQLGQIMPAFAEMVGGAMGSFRDNPSANFMGALLGMPIQMDTPDFVNSFINKYKAPEPQTQEQQFGALPTGAPKFNVNDYMRNRFMGPRR